MPEAHTDKFQITFDWRSTVLALLFMPLTLTLGFWQLDRAEEKRQLQGLFEQRQSGPVLPIEALIDNEDLQYQPVRLQGEYINEKKLFLDNRIHHGRFGYEIITPFKLAASDRLVMVNRGWLAGDRSRRSLPEIEAVTGLVELSGEVYVPKGEMLLLAPPQDSGWPRVLQSIKIDTLKGDFDLPLFPYTVRINSTSPGSYQPNWVVVNLQPQKHTGYAVQWFAMSGALLLILLLANTNLWALLKGRRQ